MSKVETAVGVITRVLENDLAYARTLQASLTLAFPPGVVEGFRGQFFQDMGIVEGATVVVFFDSATGIVAKVSLRTTNTDERAAELMQMLEAPPPRVLPKSGRAQRELLPEHQATKEVVVERALPPAVRSFRKLVDTTPLQAGDLLLTREVKPDRVSQTIAEVQSHGGYDPLDSRWTHAAMYLGDGANVVEATFDSIPRGGSVRITSLDQYSSGEHALRFRRPRHIADEREGWRVCVRALSRLTTGYSIIEAAFMWLNVMVRGVGFYSSEMRLSSNRAVICSTLYADAYNEGTRRSLGDVNGVCVPAWLSASSEFADLQVRWVRLC